LLLGLDSLAEDMVEDFHFFPAHVGFFRHSGVPPSLRLTQ
jgi:hypothetical protein